MKVALFVTCLVDMMRPQVGMSAIKLLEQADCEVIIPAQQTCCGQPAYNSGARHAAKKLAKQVIDHFDTFEYTVVPSGSCAGIISRLATAGLLCRNNHFTVCLFQQFDCRHPYLWTHHVDKAGNK